MTWKSAVTVQGGSRRPFFRIRCQAAVQLLWQSSSAPKMPPLSDALERLVVRLGLHSRRPLALGKLRMRSPFSFAGPQPKQRFSGA